MVPIKALTAGLLLVLLASVTSVSAAEYSQEAKDGTQQNPSAILQQFKTQLDAIRAEYEKRIKELEAQVEDLQIQMLRLAPEEESSIAAAPVAGQYVPNVLNPAISVIGNMVGRADDRKIYTGEGDRIDNKMNLREVELDLRVPVDPYADAVIITSFESEVPGEFEASVEEGYVNIKKLPFLERPPLGLKLKVGRFRPSFGVTNLLHTHDLPQSFRSLPNQEFLGEEGFIQDGVSGSFFLPTPWDEESSLDLTLQFLGGGNVAISPDRGGRNAYLGHLRWFRTFAQSHDIQVGWSSYYHPAGKGASRVDFHGLDFTYRWKPTRQGQWKSFLVGGEFFFTRRAFPEALQPPEVEQALEGTDPGQGRPQGFSIFGQWQFDRRKYAGIRWDQTDVLFNPQLQRYSVTPYFSYYFSEFLRFRLNYEHRWSDLFTEDGRQSVFLELNWVFGSHPPEPFWVNR